MPQVVVLIPLYVHSLENGASLLEGTLFGPGCKKDTISNLSTLRVFCHNRVCKCAFAHLRIVVNAHLRICAIRQVSQSRTFSDA